MLQYEKIYFNYLKKNSFFIRTINMLTSAEPRPVITKKQSEPFNFQSFPPLSPPVYAQMSIIENN